MIRIAFESHEDVAVMIDGLLEAADRWDTERPFLARRYRTLADRIGDELDKLPNPSAFRAQVEAKRASHATTLGRAG
jgi:hypothetical protein